MAEPLDRSFGFVRARPRLIPHKTRVTVPGGAAGVVLSVENARRRLLGIGARVEVPAKVVVILDSGRRVEHLAADVTVVASERTVVKPQDVVTPARRMREKNL